MENGESLLQALCSVQLLGDWSSESVPRDTSRQSHEDTMQQLHCELADAHCFASELERDIAALEAQTYGDEDWEQCAADTDAPGSSDTCLYKAVSNDLHSCDQHPASSDDEVDADEGDSEIESDDADDALPARVRANAAMLQRCGRPLQLGAWKGCCKSAWCDREDRHRGLCNHRATIPGPAVCSRTRSGDTCSSEQQDEAQGEACAPRCCQAPAAAAAELSSGGHSHNCKSSRDTADGGEREVASALKPGTPGSSSEEPQLPFGSNSTADQQQHASISDSAATAAAAGSPSTPLGQQLPPADLEFWGCCGSSAGSELAAAAAAAAAAAGSGAGPGLFVMPGAYQPLVKDLSASGISSVLSGSEEVLCNVDGALHPSAALQPLKMQFDDDTSMDCSCQTIAAKPSAAFTVSTPSSPSCVSAEAASTQQHQQQQQDFFRSSSLSAAAVPPPVPAPALARLLSAAARPSAAAPAAAVAVDSSVCSLAGLLPLGEVHPTSCMLFPAAARPAGTAAADPQPMSATTSSASEQQAAGDSAANPTAAACEDAAEGGAARGGSAAAAAAAAATAHTTSARVRAIKHKQAERAARALLEQQSSPNKGKKRPAGRMAPNPSSGHSCSQCGAVSTPVWRAGPAGPKTLCNACGVRYMKNARRK